MAAFDGKTSWTTNYMTMKAEESTSDDSENARRTAKEFPNGLINYKSHGYAATLLGIKQVYAGRYTSANLLRLIAEEGATFSHCVPTILQMLLSAPEAVEVTLTF